MDKGQLAYMSSRLVLGAAAAFFAIVLWSKTRDAVWMLVITGVIAGYAETVYLVLEALGIAGRAGPAVGSVPFLSILLAGLPAAFFLAAFVTAAARRYRKRL